MDSRSMYAAGLSVCLTFVAMPVAAQMATGGSSQSASAPRKQATANATSSEAVGATAAQSSGGIHMHHSGAHHQAHAKHAHMAASSAIGTQETAYRTALKNCVSGPTGQRDGCLDDTIARFGRS